MKIDIKIILTSIACIALMHPGWCDSIITTDGTVITGKIEAVLDSLILINTKDGAKRICRNLNTGITRDIIEIGYFNKRKIVGKILYYDDDKLELQTSTGELFINSNKIRNIIMAQDVPNF